MKYNIEKEILEKLYNIDNLSISDIATIIGCSVNNIYFYLKKYEIARRKRTAPNFKNLTGMKFGDLTVVERSPVGQERQEAYWICACNCGNSTTVRASHLVGKKIMSCGCKQFDCHWKGCGDISGELWGRIKKGAIERDFCLDITIEQAWELYLKQEGKCAISGVAIKFSTFYKGDQTASLDRIDSSKGYTVDNVQWVHKTINKIKGTLTDSELINWCKIIAKNN